jgi:hypothetical protein
MTERLTVPPLDRQWTDADWDQFSAYHAQRATMRSKRVPLAEVFEHLKCGENIRARIAKLQPLGPLEGDELRGWHPHHTFRDWRLDVIMPRDFITKFGRDAYRSLPRTALIRRGHRKAVRQEYVEDLLQ